MTTETQQVSERLSIVRVEADKRLVTGWLYVAEDENGVQVEDLKRAICPPEVLYDAAVEYSRDCGVMSVMHRRDQGGQPVQVGRLCFSMVFTREIWDQLGGKPAKAPQCGWLVTYYVDDDATWEAVKRGDYPDLSFAGSAEVEYL